MNYRVLVGRVQSGLRGGLTYGGLSLEGAGRGEENGLAHSGE